MHAITGPEDFARAFAVSRETLSRLERYADLLRQWQKTINLVAPSTLPDLWQRHFADSAQLIRHAPPGAYRWLDLGSGAGFPGMVIAILLQDRCLTSGQTSRLNEGCLTKGQTPTKYTLLESDSRKAAFLREVARQTGLRRAEAASAGQAGVAVDIVAQRIESPSTQVKVGRIDCVTARALAPLGRLLDLAAPFLSSDSKGLFLKGRDVEAEIADARQTWAFDVALHPSVSDPEGRVAVISNLRVKSEG